MKRVLVTGASGFVGRCTLRVLASRSYEVHATCRGNEPLGEAIWHRVDLHDRERTARLLRDVRPTHLLHLAWYAEHGHYWTSPENLRWVESSLALLRGFVETGGQRAVVAGTCAEYDWRYGFCSEAVTPLRPATLYGASKHALHTVAAAYADQAGLSLAWARLFFLYGPGEPPARLVPSVVRALLNGAAVRCSHGHQVRDYLYVEDAAAALAALLDTAVGGPVNIASGRPTTIRELVATAVALFPGQEDKAVQFGAIATPADDPPVLVADVRRLVNEVQWSPAFDHVQGLSRMLDSVQ